MAMIYALEGTRDWSNAGSFNTAMDGSGSAGLPVDGDTLIVFGDTYVSAGHTGLSGVNLAYMYVRGTLLASATLSLQVSSGTTGELHIQNGTGTLAITSASTGIDRILFSPRSGGAGLSLESGTFPSVLMTGGTLTQQSSATVTTLVKSGGNATLYDGTTAITLFVNSGGGLVDCQRSCTTAHNNGFLQVSNDAALATIHNWGTINDRSNAAPTTLNMYAGVYSVAGSPVARTIGTANWYGGRIVSKVLGSDLLTITTNNNYTGGALESASTVPPFSSASGLY